MTTVTQMVDNCLLQLEGYNDDQSVYGTLNGAVLSADTSFTVSGPTLADGSGMSIGLVEVENELMYVRSLDRATGVASDVIRGWRGTTPANHSDGTVVRANPTYPRVQVLNAINAALRAVWPRVFAVASATITADEASPVYTVSGADNVLRVQWISGAGNIPIESTSWRWDKTTGKVAVFDVPHGSTITVTYSREPVTVTASDSFSTTLLPTFAETLIQTGAILEILKGQLLSPLPTVAVEQTVYSQSGMQLGGASANAVKLYQAMFEQELQRAEKKLSDMYPPQVHYINAESTIRLPFSFTTWA